MDRVTIDEISPLSSVQPFPIAYESYPAITFQKDSVSSLEQIIQIIPTDARIGVQDSLLALWQPRQPFYVLPSLPSGTSGISDFLGSRLDMLEYILFQWTPNPQWQGNISLADVCLSDPAISSKFGVVAWSDGIVLLKRSYSGPPEVLKPFSMTFGTGDLIPRNGTMLIQDSTAKRGLALEHFPGNGTDFWWGSHAQLPPGTYLAEYHIKSGTTQAEALTLNVNVFLSNGTEITVSSSQLSGHSLQPSESYVWVTLPFVASLYGVYEFPGLNANASSPMFIDSIILTMQDPSSYFAPAQ